ncbi:MAG: glycosyltransferase [Planctomycetota bacterium]
MTHVLHLIDAATDETQLQTVALLRGKMATMEGSSSVCAMDGVDRETAASLLGETPQFVPRRLLHAMNWAPNLGRMASECNPGLVHAWGIDAARAAGARLKGVPMVLSILDPSQTREAAKWVRALAVGTTVVAGSQIIRSRLVTAGLPSEQVVVIRAGVDFSAINNARRLNERKELVGDGSPVVLMHGPASVGGGQYFGVWAAGIVAQIHHGLRIVLPYESAESRRVQRFASSIKMGDATMVPDRSWTWPRLLACADVFCAPAIEEISSEPLACAMASGVVVVGSAVRSIAEIIADKHNGLLCKSGDPRILAGRILTAIEDVELRRRVTDTARGQAYEVFSVRAFAENYQRLYENVLASRAPGEGIGDTAMVA